MTITPVALTFRHQGGDNTVVVEIVLVSIVALVFLIRLTLALHGHPSRTRNR